MEALMPIRIFSAIALGAFLFLSTFSANAEEAISASVKMENKELSKKLAQASLQKLYSDAAKIKDDPYSTATMVMQMGDYEYEFPRNVTDSYITNECNKKSWSLKFLLPNYEGLTSQNEKQMLYTFGRERQVISVFVQRFKKNGSEFFEKNLRTWMDLIKPVEKSLSYPVYGLTLFRRPYPSKEFSKHDLYVKRNSKKELVSFLLCSEEGTVDSPGCQHHFLLNGFNVQLHYDRHLLYRWDEIETKIKTILTSYKVKKVENHFTDCNY